MANIESSFSGPGSSRIQEQLSPGNELARNSEEFKPSYLLTPPRSTNLDNQGWASQHTENDQWYAYNLESALIKAVEQNLDPQLRDGFADTQQVWVPTTTNNVAVQQPATPHSQSNNIDGPLWNYQFLTPQSLTHNSPAISVSHGQWQHDQSSLPPTPTPASQNQALIAKFYKDGWFAWNGRGSTHWTPDFVNYGIDVPFINQRLFRRPKFGQLPTVVSIHTPPGDFGEIPLDVFMRIVGNLTLPSFFNLIRCSKWIKVCQVGEGF